MRDLIPAPNYVLIDPEDKNDTTSYMKLPEEGRSYKGYVVAIGEPEADEKGIVRKFFAEVGDLVLYSMAGVERTKLTYKDWVRHEFILAPYSRVILKLKK